MTDFLFVTYEAVLWFLAVIFAGSFLFSLAVGNLLRRSRIKCERLHAELDGHLNEVAAAHADVERLRRERDVLDRATDIFICASAQLERERQERERDSG